MSTTGAGGLPASTCSKCRVASRVLALQEESPGKLQADADEAGVRDQHGAEGRDGLVQQRLPLRLGDVRLLRRADRRHAGLESDVQMPRTCRRQRPQYGQRLFEPARLEQSLRLRDLGRGRPAGRGWRWRLLAGTPCRRGEEQERRGRKHAEEGADYHRLTTFLTSRRDRKKRVAKPATLFHECEPESQVLFEGTRTRQLVYCLFAPKPPANGAVAEVGVELADHGAGLDGRIIRVNHSVESGAVGTRRPATMSHAGRGALVRVNCRSGARAAIAARSPSSAG